jgi:hypothetical protein
MALRRAWERSNQETPIFIEQFIIDPNLAAIAQVTNHIPVNGALIDRAGLWITLA